MHWTRMHENSSEHSYFPVSVPFSCLHLPFFCSHCRKYWYISLAGLSDLTPAWTFFLTYTLYHHVVWTRLVWPNPFSPSPGWPLMKCMFFFVAHPGFFGSLSGCLYDSPSRGRDLHSCCPRRDDQSELTTLETKMIHVLLLNTECLNNFN